MNQRPARIAFLGDISLNDEYRDLARREVDLFSAVSPLLAGHDLVIGNLEAVCEGEDGELWTKRPRLRTDPTTLGRLLDLGPLLVTLAHNHVYDHLGSGFRRTTETLETLGIPYMGAGETDERAREPLRREIGGWRFTFLNYVARNTNPKLPPDVSVSLNYFDIDRAVREVTTAREDADFVVVLLHWGGDAEEADFPHPAQTAEARRLVMAGADLIVGHHPHTLQPEERVRRDHTSSGGDHASRPERDRASRPERDHVSQPGRDHVFRPGGDHAFRPGGDHASRPGRDQESQPARARAVGPGESPALRGDHERATDDRGGWVFYSLGNFCFADVVCDGKVWEIDWERNARSVILSVSFGQDGVEPESIPIRNRNHRIVLDDSFWPEVERSRRWFPLFRRPLFFRLHRLRVRYLDRPRFYFWGNDRNFWTQARRLSPGKVFRFLRNS